ncbi:TatD family hydrolase [Geomonas sp. Red32]|uniref:TatD family hydrolase n=1 Tax=Geomonas sp. Red32 TaxID=2912856 RepID=UPI00202CD38C|nr:TatD family hydrolase [Geomonas sp. Red32]MCM0080624.1 TatD family hydrolase [Geomonas sp. Red32]
MLFDSHCHLDDPLLLDSLPEVLAEAETAGVGGMLVPGVHPDGWPVIASLAAAHPRLIPAFGLHPMHAALWNDQLLATLRSYCRNGAAVGEIGLDYLIASPGRELQRAAFRAQLALACDLGLPVLIHCRKAFADLLAIIGEVAGSKVKGVMHAFSGSPETARACLRTGLYISLAGPVTFSNAVKPAQVAASVPLDRLLLETDAPDLTPEPHRGLANRPAFLPFITDKVASIRGITAGELARATSANARRLFELPPSLIP